MLCTLLCCKVQNRLIITFSYQSLYLKQTLAGCFGPPTSILHHKMHPPPNDHQIVADPTINTTVARSVRSSAVRTLAPLVQIDAVSFATARADPIVAAVSLGDGAEAGAVLDVAGRFDADGTGGSGLEGFGFLGDGEGGGANAEEREACECGEGEHGIVLSGREVVSTRGAVLLELSRRGRTLKSDGERGRCFFVSE